VHVVVACQQRLLQCGEDARFIAAKIIGKDEVQRSAGFLLLFVVSARVIPVATTGHLLCGQAEKEEILFPGFFRHFNGGAVAGP